MNQTISAYNKYHDVYDKETIDFWKNFPKTTIKTFASNLKGNQILNLGSGPGRDSLLLKNAGLDVTCLDASKEMIKRTKKLGFKSVESDFEKMPFENEIFDGVWAYTSLLHVTKSKMEKILNKIHSIIKPEGIFLIGMIEGKYIEEKESESMPGVKRYFRYYTEQELRKVVEQSGFEMIFQERYVPNKKVYLSQIYKKIK